MGIRERFKVQPYEFDNTVQKDDRENYTCKADINGMIYDIQISKLKNTYPTHYIIAFGPSDLSGDEKEDDLNMGIDLTDIMATIQEIMLNIVGYDHSFWLGFGAADSDKRGEARE